MPVERKTKLLVVDDEPEVADGLALYGKRMGYQTFVAYDGPSAVAKAEAERPDIILLDISLPGMDGRDVMRELKASGVADTAIVVFVTARDSQTDRIVGLELGAADYEAKPLHFGMLFKKIERLLEKKSLGEL